MIRVLTRCLLVSLALGAATEARADGAEAILKKADEVRNPADSYRLVVDVKSDDDESEMEVSIKGHDRTFVKTLKPERDKGRTMLMLGEDMWVSMPKTKKPIRVSLNQKLSGQAANGDITRQRWSGDYAAKIESETDKQWVLKLVAERDNLTYDRIRLWVDKKTYRPAKAEYLTKSGKLLKKATFQGYKHMAGGMRPTETVITSATSDHDKSVITIRELETKDFPDSLFNQNALN